MIQILSASDAIEIAALLAEAGQANQTASAAVKRVPVGPIWSVEQVSSELRSATAWGYHFENRLVAFVLVREMGEIWEIVHLATHPTARRQGRMSELLRTLLWKIPSGGKVWLEVHEHNEPARALYEKFGFRRAGDRMRYYADGGTAILYSYGEDLA